MTTKQFKTVYYNITDFLEEYGIEYSGGTVSIEREWVDFSFQIPDIHQIERIHTWLQDDLKLEIPEWTDIEVSAPAPMAGKEHELRVRVYQLGS